MDYDEFTRHVNKAGLQLKDFAELIDVYPQSISRYSGEDVPPKYAVLAVLLGHVVDQKLVDAAKLFSDNDLVWPVKQQNVTRLDVYRTRKSRQDGGSGTEVK